MKIGDPGVKRLALLEPPNRARVRVAHSPILLASPSAPPATIISQLTTLKTPLKASLLAITAKSLSRASRMRNHGDRDDARKLPHSIGRPNISLG